MRSLWLLACLWGCVESSSIVCGDKTCPSGTFCDVSGRCLSDAQVAACTGLGENDPCSTAAGAGQCIAGACISARCGDGIRVGTEQCDGNDLGDATCGSLGFYEEGTGLACNTQCQFNTNACTGGRCGDNTVASPQEQCEPGSSATTTCDDLGYYETTAVSCTGFCTWNTSVCEQRCGDGIVQITEGEVCDGAPPSNGCLSYRFDYGAINCALCGPEFSQCGSIGWIDQIPSPGSIRAISGTFADLWASRQGLVSRRMNHGGWVDAYVNGQDGQSTYVRGPNDVFVTGTTSVGSLPTVVHFDGTNWTPTTLPSANINESQAGITGIASGDVYAVTNNTNGGLYRYSGTWSRLATINGALGVWASASNDIYAWTNIYTLQHSTGGAFSPVTVPGCTQVYGAWGTSSTNVFVACNGGVARYTGTWASSLVTSGNIAAISGSSANNIIATGFSGQAWRFDGTAWYDIPAQRPIGAVWTDGSSVVAAATTGLVEIDGGVYQGRLNEMPGVVPTEAWAGGTDTYVATDSGVFKRTGTVGWVDITPAVGGGVEHVWGFSPSDVFITDSSGKLWHWTGASWGSGFATMSSRAPLSLWGTSATDMWAVTTASATLYIDRYNGSWSNVTTFAWNGSTVMLRGTSSSDVWLTQSTNTIQHYNGSTWTPYQLPQVMYAVWAISPTNALALSYNTLYRWNGSTWSPEDIGTTTPLLAVWARSANDIFVGGSQGVIVHFDGSRWSPVRDTRLAEAVLAIAGTSDRVVFARDQEGPADLLYQLAPWN